MKSPQLYGLALCLSLTVASAACQRSHRTVAQTLHGTEAKAVPVNEATTPEEIDLAFKQEVRQSFTLKPGDDVSISGINGLLKIETSDNDTAEIYIVRSVQTEADFNDRKLVIEQNGTRLKVRVQNNRERSVWAMLGSRHEERQRAYLKLPRQIALGVSGINGKTEVGEITGSVDISGCNGPVNVTRVTNELELSGVNGNIQATVAQLTRGLDVSGINGNIDIRFSGELNADLDVSGFNGQVKAEFPNANVKTNKQGRYAARIGTGGVEIDLNGINGNITLAPTN